MIDRKEEIEKLTNEIIKSLYDADGKVRKRGGLYEEPINWGDLGVCEVKQDIDGTFIIFIEEADPSCCEFNNFIAEELKKKGIEATVITEW
jgi:hypothetical protein